MISKTITSVAIIIAVAAMFISSGTIVSSVLVKINWQKYDTTGKGTDTTGSNYTTGKSTDTTGKVLIQLAVINQLAKVLIQLAVINQLAGQLNKTIKTSKNVYLMQKVQMVLRLNQKLKVALTQFIFQLLQLPLLQ